MGWGEGSSNNWVCPDDKLCLTTFGQLLETCCRQSVQCKMTTVRRDKCEHPMRFSVEPSNAIFGLGEQWHDVITNHHALAVVRAKEEPHFQRPLRAKPLAQYCHSGYKNVVSTKFLPYQGRRMHLCPRLQELCLKLFSKYLGNVLLLGRVTLELWTSSWHRNYRRCLVCLWTPLRDLRGAESRIGPPPLKKTQKSVSCEVAPPPQSVMCGVDLGYGMVW